MAKSPSPLTELALEATLKVHVENCRRLAVALIDTPYFPDRFYFTHEKGLATVEVEQVELPNETIVRLLRLENGDVTAPTYFGLPNSHTIPAGRKPTLKVWSYEAQDKRVRYIFLSTKQLSRPTKAPRDF